jgi:hypothetical protein
MAKERDPIKYWEHSLEFSASVRGNKIKLKFQVTFVPLYLDSENSVK